MNERERLLPEQNTASSLVPALAHDLEHRQLGALGGRRLEPATVRRSAVGRVRAVHPQRRRVAVLLLLTREVFVAALRRDVVEVLADLRIRLQEEPLQLHGGVKVHVDLVASLGEADERAGPEAARVTKPYRFGKLAVLLEDRRLAWVSVVFMRDKVLVDLHGPVTEPGLRLVAIVGEARVQRPRELRTQVRVGVDACVDTVAQDGVTKQTVRRLRERDELQAGVVDRAKHRLLLREIRRAQTKVL